MELCGYLGKVNNLSDRMVAMNLGGTVQLKGGVSATMVQAVYIRLRHHL